jgi:hypothetical protein
LGVPGGWCSTPSGRGCLGSPEYLAVERGRGDRGLRGFGRGDLPPGTVRGPRSSTPRHLRAGDGALTGIPSPSSSPQIRGIPEMTSDSRLRPPCRQRKACAWGPPRTRESRPLPCVETSGRVRFDPPWTPLSPTPAGPRSRCRSDLAIMPRRRRAGKTYRRKNEPPAASDGATGRDVRCIRRALSGRCD